MASFSKQQILGGTKIVYVAVLEIVVGHRTFSDQNWYLSEYFWFWSDKMSKQKIMF